MIQIKARVVVESDRIAQWNERLALPQAVTDAGLCEVMDVLCIDIGNDNAIDIRLCNHKDGPYIDVLLLTADVVYEGIARTNKLLGHHTFIHDGTAYSVEVCEEKVPAKKRKVTTERKKVRRVRSR